ncbi:MAG: TonB-dependent siderophore receptor [Pseudomonadota bacterium]
MQKHGWRLRPLIFACLLAYAGAGMTQDATQLPTVEVKAEAATESATGPVGGYAATRSATATKTDTPLVETPASISIVTRERIEDQGATSLQDALNYAAGVRSDAYGLDSRTDSVRVRGTYPAEFKDGLARQLTGYYTSSTRNDPFLFERIEVLRGPASMLYGQGSTAGIINLVTKRPLPEAQREIGVQYGSFDRKQLQMDFTGPLTEDGQFLYRLIAVARDADTQVDHVEDDRKLFAPSLTWRPGPDTSLTLQALWQDDHSGSTSQFFPWRGVRLPNPNGSIPLDRFIGEPGFDRYDSERKEIGWLFEHRLNGDWTVRQHTRYAHNRVEYRTLYADSFSNPDDPFIDPDDRVMNRWAFLEDRTTKVLATDQHLVGKFRTGAVQHQLLLGFDYASHHSEAESGGGFGFPIDIYAPVYGNFVEPAMADGPYSRMRHAGVYVQDQLRFGRWILTAGLRHDRVTSKAEGQDEEKDRATTRRAAVMYRFDGGIAPYVSYTESFTPVAGVNAAGRHYKPLEGEQVEIGIKFEPPGRRMMYNLAFYELKESNQLVADPLNPGSSLQTGEIVNRGFEAEAIGRLLPWLDIAAHYNYIDIDPTLEAIPKHQAAVWAQSRFSIGDRPGFLAGLGVRYFSAFTDSAAPRTPSVTLYDAMIGYQHGPWHYALNVQNIEDEKYVSTCLGRGDCWFGARRTAVLTASYRF